MGVLDDRILLVTGAAGGIGAAVARRLVADGARVVLTDLDETAAKEVAETFAPGTTVACGLDVRDADGWTAAVDLATATFGRLDGLVNNAGVLAVGTVAEMPADDFRAVLETNSIGVLLGIQAVTPALRSAGGGTIVNVASIDGQIGFRYLSAYCASKAAVLAISRTAAMELGSENIRVNAVSPGVIDTPMTADLDAHVTKWLHRTLPLRRLGRPAEIADVVSYLTSEASSYVTGTEIVADGGLLAGFLLP